MRLLYKGADGQPWDLTQLVVSISWAGDYKQAARTLDLELAKGNPVTDGIALGDVLKLMEGNEELFFGYAFVRTRELETKTVQVRAYDGGVYLLKSNIARNFENMTAQAVTRQAAAELGIPVGAMPPDAGVSVSFAHINKSAYSAIMGAWTKVHEATGYKYLPRMKEGLLTIAVIGAEYAPFLLAPDSNLVAGSVSDSLEDAVTQVRIVDDKGKSLAFASDAPARDRYGVLQATDSKKDGLDPDFQAKKMLKGPEQQITLNQIIGGPGARLLVAGNACAVHDPGLGLTGKYFILNDEHQFRDGRHTVSVGLSFDALMDEQEIETVKKAAAATVEETGDPWKTARELGLLI